MGPSSKLVWKVYMGVLGGVTTVAAQRGITMAWKTVTGKEPPSPTDPETPWFEAASWAAASGVGVGLTQFVITRFAANRWVKDTGKRAPKIPEIKLKI